MPSIYTAVQFDEMLGCTHQPPLPQMRVALLNYARTRCGSAAAEDLVQEALIAAWNCIDRFNADDGRGPFLRWLKRFVDHACYDFIYQRAMNREYPSGDMHADHAQNAKDIPVELDDTVQCLLSLAQRRELYALLEVVSLSYRQKRVVTLWLKGLSLYEIADHLGLKYTTVWEHKEAAQRKLARWKDERDLDILECLLETTQPFIYHAPTATGALLAKEQLEKMAQSDARHHGYCMRRAKARLHTQRVAAESESAARLLSADSPPALPPQDTPAAPLLRLVEGGLSETQPESQAEPERKAA